MQLNQILLRLTQRNQYKTMRKLILLTLALAIISGNTANSAYAQQQDKGKTKSVTLTATVPQDEDEEIVAYSDTTSASDTTLYNKGKTHINIGPNGISINGNDDMEDFDIGDEWLLSILKGTAGTGAILFAILIVLLVFLFLIAPFIIIALIIWYLVRRDKKRAEIANKAMESGQPIPQEKLPVERQTDDYLWKKGIRNAFLGLGLFIADFFLGSDILSAIGVIIACMGIGQAIIAKTSSKSNKQDKDQDLNKEENQSEDEKLG